MEDIEKQRRKTMSHEENGNMIATRLDLERVVLLTTPRYLHLLLHIIIHLLYYIVIVGPTAV